MIPSYKQFCVGKDLIITPSSELVSPHVDLSAILTRTRQQNVVGVRWAWGLQLAHFTAWRAKNTLTPPHFVQLQLED